jgi:1,6-anhydro-N-acetylmuramate kinase
MICLAGGRISDAVRIDAALERQIERAGRKVHPLTRAFRARLQETVAAAGATDTDLSRWRDEGAGLSDEAAVALALR